MRFAGIYVVACVASTLPRAAVSERLSGVIERYAAHLRPSLVDASEPIQQERFAAPTTEPPVAATGADSLTVVWGGMLVFIASFALVGAAVVSQSRPWSSSVAKALKAPELVGQERLLLPTSSCWQPLWPMFAAFVFIAFFLLFLGCEGRFWNLLGKPPSLDEASRSMVGTPFLGTEQASLSELARRLQASHNRHHICITGPGANAVADLLLHAGNASRALLHLTSPLSEQVCTVQEAHIGKTLFTISSEISDRCSARWRGQSATCDIRLHAQNSSQQTCEELFKVRLMDNECERPMLVVADRSSEATAGIREGAEAARNCLLKRLERFQEDVPLAVDDACKRNIQWLEGPTSGRPGRLVDALSGALDLMEQFQQRRPHAGSSHSEADCTTSPAGADSKALRRCLHQEHARRPASQVALHEEIMRQLQGLPVHHSVAALQLPSFLQMRETQQHERSQEPDPEETQSEAEKEAVAEALQANVTSDGGDVGLTASNCGALGTVCPVVLDNGGSTIRVGFAGEAKPRAIFPAVVGHLKMRQDVDLAVADASKPPFVGYEATRKQGMLSLQYPLEHGITGDSQNLEYESWDNVWQDVEAIWRYALVDALRVDPEKQPILLTEAPLNAPSNREQMARTMFEKFNVPGLYVISFPVLALYAAGRTSGCVLHSGNIASYIVPVWEGYSMPHAITKFQLGGKDLTNYMMRLMSRRGYSFTEHERAIAEDIKETLTYVAQDFEREKAAYRPYRLPKLNVNGDSLAVGKERYKVPEALFNPRLLADSVGRAELAELPGVHKLVYQTISQKCAIDTRRDLYQNIILSGGNTLFPGLDKRLRKELSALLPPAMEVKVEAPASRRFSAWLGGSLLGSMSMFNSSWVTREQYEQRGQYDIPSLMSSAVRPA